MDVTWAVVAFLGLAAVIGVAGTFLTKIADRLADVTGLGEALVGGILLGGVTSLSGITTSVTAAAEGHPELAFSNAVGGIAAQTVFLAFADIAYRKANLEHASASFTSLIQGVVLILMLGFIILTMAAPPFAVAAVHPASIGLLVIYVLGSRLASQAGKNPMWQPTETSETVTDEPEDENRQYGLPRLLIQFTILAAVVGVAGYYVAQTAVIITEQTSLSESFVGALGTSVATSLPELVVSVTAVRQGALTLAVSNIIGGNTFDILFLAFADIAFREGSLYHYGTDRQLFVISLTIVLTGILLLGLLHRQKYGIGKVGWESALSIFLFLAGYVVLYFM